MVTNELFWHNKLQHADSPDGSPVCKALYGIMKKPKPKVTIHDLPFQCFVAGLGGIVLSIVEFILFSFTGLDKNCSLSALFSLGCKHAGHMGLVYIFFGLSIFCWLISKILSLFQK